MNRKIVPNLKSSILALGLSLKDHSQPFKIVGTGFFIHEDGFFLTADHVGTDMGKIFEHFKEKGMELEYRGFWHEKIDDKHGQLLGIKIEHGRSIEIEIPEIKEHLLKKQDLMIGRVSGKGKYPFLNFDKATKMDILDEVFICGFPGGMESFRPHDDIIGDSISAILQYGRIASLLPVDYSENPYGIQTDIVVTTGSSGSPIVDANTGQVLGIVQRVIPSDVFDSALIDQNVIGNVALGLAWGISNYFFTEPTHQMLNILKSEFDENGSPLPSDQIQDKVIRDDIFYPKKL